MQIKNRIKPRKVLLALLLGALTLALSACGGDARSVPRRDGRALPR